MQLSRLLFWLLHSLLLLFWDDIKIPPFIWFYDRVPCLHQHFYVHLHFGHKKDQTENASVGGRKPVALDLLLTDLQFLPGTPQIQKVMTVLISDHADLFPPSKDVPPSPPAHKNDKKATIPRSSVGWDAAEDPAVPRAESVIQRQMVRLDPQRNNKTYI